MSEVPEEVWRRIRKLEEAVENGRFIRRDYFDLTIASLRSDTSRIAADIAGMEADLKKEREAREDDWKGLRNLIIGAALSLLVALIVSQAVPP